MVTLWCARDCKFELFITEFSEFSESIQGKSNRSNWLICVDRENEEITEIVGLCK